VTHEEAWTRLPDLLHDRDRPALLSHLKSCHECQRQQFRLNRVDRMLRAAAPRARKRRPVRVVPWAVAAVAALIVVLAPVLGQHTRSTQVLRTPAGIAVGRAALSRSDGASVAVFLELHRVTISGGDSLVVWTRSVRSSVPVPVGRFMADADGSCRARFTLPARSDWTRFWVSPGEDASVILATT